MKFTTARIPNVMRYKERGDPVSGLVWVLCNIPSPALFIRASKESSTHLSIVSPEQMVLNDC